MAWATLSGSVTSSFADPVALVVEAHGDQPFAVEQPPIDIAGARQQPDVLGQDVGRHEDGVFPVGELAELGAGVVIELEALDDIAARSAVEGRAAAAA
jgi:hypothetical protein